MDEKRDRVYWKWGLTALGVICISVVLVVIFTDLPGFFGVLRGLEAILEPLILGAVFAFLLNPIVRFVDTRLGPLLGAKTKWKAQAVRNVSRGAGVVTAVIVAALILYAFFSMLLPQLYESVVGIVDNAENYYTSIDRWVTNVLEDNPEIQGYVDSALGKIYEFINNWITTTFLQDVQKLLATVTTSVVAVVKSLMNVLIGLVASVYILWSKETFQAQGKKIIVAAFSRKGADHIFYLGRNIYRVFNGFVIGKIVDSAIIGVLCYIGILILKMPYPALIATVIGVTNVIPFFGPIIGLVPCAFLILLVNPLQAFYFVIFILVLQQVDGNVIGPKILGNTVGISGFWVLGAGVDHDRGESVRVYGDDPRGAGVRDPLSADLRLRQRKAPEKVAHDRHAGLSRHPDRRRAAKDGGNWRKIGQILENL